MKKKLLFLLLFVFLMVCAVSVSAVGTRLNISMKEVVYNNITFAENFFENEANPFCRIYGTINITNPEADNIFDIYITYYNVNRMTTDFIWVDGKPGAMSLGGAGISSQYGEIGNTANNVTLTQDLDNDNSNDYIWTNGTGVYLNLSTDGLIYIALKNSTGNDVSIVSAGTTPVDIYMNQFSINKSGETYGNLTIIGEANQNNILNASINITINEYFVSPIVIHIPELRPGNYTTFIYNITCVDTEPPVNIETDYSNSYHANIDRKVLAGNNWTITQKAINNLYLNLNITNLNITITAQPVIWNDTTSYFKLEYLNPTGDAANVYGNGTSNVTWWWAPNGGTLENQTEVNITYRVIAPQSVPFSAIYMAIIENITYDANFLMSNLSLAQVNASAKINMSIEKRISQPATNEFDNNVTWEIKSHLDTPLNITFDVNKVTLWVTNDLNPNNISIHRNRNQYISSKVGTSYNNKTLTVDLNEDSNVDYAYVNSTYIIFNISGTGLKGVPLGTNISVAAPGSPVAVTLTNGAITGTLCYVSINGSTDIANVLDTDNMTIFVWCELKKIYSGSPLANINISTDWDSSQQWYFNYSDGSNSTNPPPIVWIKPEWLLNYGFGQILNYSNSINGEDLYIKYIYVINGYWLEVQKNITNIAEGSYMIYIYVENIGNGWTPQFEKVTVYDFVPINFAPYSWSASPNANQSIGSVGSEFYGTSYVWDIPWKAGMNSSLGPKNGDLATDVGNYSWNATYYVNGSGPYKITDLYIVGLDPLKVDGASASPLIAVVTGLKSYSKEIIYIGIVLFLVIVNIANLIITHRINKKLDDSAPHVQQTAAKKSIHHK